MTQSIVLSPHHKSMILLSRMLLLPIKEETMYSSTVSSLKFEVQSMGWEEFTSFIELGSTNHVLVRGLEVLLSLLLDGDDVRIGWAETALATERGRIETALGVLSSICQAFAARRYDLTVIKSLDHWPDLGSDLDLYTNTDSGEASRLMKTRFNAQIAPQSWGDRLAGKWNFMIPGLPEAVEIHMGRLGQTGEQAVIAAQVASRSRLVSVGNWEFRVPSASDRIMISTLQRMYRHFYFRLCDVLDSAALVECGEVDFEDLRKSAEAADIWEGVATYLVIVSDYVAKYRGFGLNLPQYVRAAAAFGGDKVIFGNGYLRVPLIPQSSRLYLSQLAGLLQKRELQNGARLSLLPLLATAAVVGQKFTGSDKGIW